MTMVARDEIKADQWSIDPNSLLVKIAMLASSFGIKRSSNTWKWVKHQPLHQQVLLKTESLGEQEICNDSDIMRTPFGEQIFKKIR